MKRTLIWIISAIVGIGCFTFIGVKANQPTGQQSVTSESFTGNGKIKQGCWGLTLITSAGFTGNISGAALASSSTYVVPVPANGQLTDVYVAVSGGTLTTIEVR